MRFYQKSPLIDAMRFEPRMVDPLPRPDPRKGEAKRKPEPTGERFQELEVMVDEDGVFVTIPTRRGNLRCNAGDWIVETEHGELFPMDPDAFAARFRPLP